MRYGGWRRMNMEEQMIEALGMRLANRAYLYRIFHIVFGAEPTSEELATIGSAKTVEAFRCFADAVRTQAGGVGVDGGGGAEASADELAKAAELLASLGEKADDGEYVDSLKSAFTRLFLVPGESYVYPWESPYIGKEVMLFQESTLDVRNRYAEYGFAAVEYGHFPEDHVSMMLDFLAHLSTRAFDAFESEEDDETRRILASQGDFIAAHLTDWLPSFCERLAEKDASGVYARLGCALKAFLAMDKRFVGEALEDGFASA